MSLSDGGIATYDTSLSDPLSGTFVFDYTVGPSDQTGSLKIANVIVPFGTKISDQQGYNADFSNALNVDTDIEIGTQTIPPTVSILTSGGLTNQAS